MEKNPTSQSQEKEITPPPLIPTIDEKSDAYDTTSLWLARVDVDPADPRPTLDKLFLKRSRIKF